MRMYGRTAADDLQARQREATAVEMRLQGYEFDEIAQRCGYADRGGAYKAWKRALKRVSDPVAEDARKAMQLRLNLYRRTLANSLLGPMADPARIHDTLVKIEEREAKLFGLDLEAQQSGATIEVYEFQPGFMEAIKGNAAPPVIGNTIEAASE